MNGVETAGEPLHPSRHIADQVACIKEVLDVVTTGFN